MVRWEVKQTTPFLRTREFLWQEGHTAFAEKVGPEEGGRWVGLLGFLGIETKVWGRFFWEVLFCCFFVFSKQVTNWSDRMRVAGNWKMEDSFGNFKYSVILGGERFGAAKSQDS